MSQGRDWNRQEGTGPVAKVRAVVIRPSRSRREEWNRIALACRNDVRRLDTYWLVVVNGHEKKRPATERRTELTGIQLNCRIVLVGRGGS